MLSLIDSIYVLDETFAFYSFFLFFYLSLSSFFSFLSFSFSLSLSLSFYFYFPHRKCPLYISIAKPPFSRDSSMMESLLSSLENKNFSILFKDDHIWMISEIALGSILMGICRILNIMIVKNALAALI